MVTADDSVPPLGARWFRPTGSPALPACVEDTALSNGIVRVTVDDDGRIAAVADARTGQQFLAAAGNELRVFLDRAPSGTPGSFPPTIARCRSNRPN